MKFIFVSGGVISGLGKGVTTASISLLLKSRGIKVAPVKCDAYMNVDAGTIRPQEHGEVFVTDDGVECDQDIGNYERFIDENLNCVNYVTNGQIYQEIIRRERSFEYNGEDVEIVPHVPEEMIRRFKQAGKDNHADVVIIEIGGTVGEYQNALFIEANRIMKYRDKEDVIHIHVGYLPTPSFLGEMKSKPVQTSVRLLASTGIQPDFIIGRAEKPIDARRKERLAWLCNIDKENVISNPDVDTIYKIPLIFKEQKLDEKILGKLKLKPKKTDLKDWENLVSSIKRVKEPLKIAIISKYAKVGNYNLSDAYISVIEAIKHAAWNQNKKPIICWIDCEEIERGNLKKLENVDGIIVPGGFGQRGTNGKIKAIKYARENNVPYLGLCFGLQLAIVEFAQNVCKLVQAHSTEINPKTKYPVIDILPEQIKHMAEKNYGATMRLGAYPCLLKKDTVAYKAYRKSQFIQSSNHPIIYERHRHRYEVNPKFHQVLQKHGMIFSGMSPNKKLVEMVELKNHPFFVASQFHPEFKSTLKNPHPLFIGFIKACM